MKKIVPMLAMVGAVIGGLMFWRKKKASSSDEALQ